MMLAPDVLIQDIDPTGWLNLLSLADSSFVRRLAGAPPRAAKKRARLIVIFEGDRVLKSHHSEKGSLLDGFRWTGPDGLEEIARAAGADQVTAVERGAQGRIYGRFQRRIGLRDDYVRQVLEIYEAVRREVGTGIFFHPPLRLRPIRYGVIQGLFRLLVPDGSTVVFYLFDGGRVWTSAILGVRNGSIDLFTSHEGLAGRGVSIAAWRKDYGRILSAVEEAFRRPSIGIFGDLVPFAQVVSARRTLKSLVEARGRRDIILDPFPLRLEAFLRAAWAIGL